MYNKHALHIPDCCSSVMVRAEPCLRLPARALLPFTGCQRSYNSLISVEQKVLHIQLFLVLLARE